MMKRLLIFFLCLGLLFPLFSKAQDADQDLEGADAVVVSSDASPLKYGDKGEEVRQLQTRLRDLFYYSAKVTGNYGSITRAAVKSVQEAYGLEATGNADSKTLEIIYGDCHRPLKRGAEGKDVARLQTRLSELGYYWGKISGRYQDGTTAAVGHFQEQNGLKKTGNADIPTLEKLYGDDVVVPTPDPKATPAPTLAPVSAEDMRFPGKLSYGAKGDKVKQVQDRLKDLGYFTRKSTGGFYKHTQAAVKAFQKNNGLETDGVVGESTWQALYAPDVARPYDPPKPSPVPTPVPYFLEVDVTNQLVKVFGLDEEGGYTKFLRAMWCSTGTKSFPSEVGTHTLTERRARWAEFPTWGGGKAQYWVRINPEIAFHSFMYKAYDTKAVNMKSVNKIGRRASHGCIRLTLHDAKWIYQNCGKGTKVWIHEDAPSDPELKAAHKPAGFSKKLYAHPITPTPPLIAPYQANQPPQGEMRNLKAGARGEDVYWLQSKLKELGYFSGTVTGVYSDGTAKAVNRYRLDNKLGKGQADKKMLTFLYEQTLAEVAGLTPVPTDPTHTKAP